MCPPFLFSENNKKRKFWNFFGMVKLGRILEFTRVSMGSTHCPPPPSELRKKEEISIEKEIVPIILNILFHIIFFKFKTEM